MAPFAGDRVWPGEQFAPNHDASTDSGADNDAKNNFGVRTGAVGRFRKRKAVRVVCETHGTAELRLEILKERLSDEPCRVRVLDEARDPRKRARHADADGSAHLRVRFNLGDEVCDRVERRSIVAARGRHAPPDQFAAVVAQRDSLDLRPAQIDPDAHASELPYREQSYATYPELGAK